MSRRRLISIFGGIVGVGAAFGLTLTFFGQRPAPLGHTTAPWQLIASIEVRDTSDGIIPHMIKVFPDDVRDAAEDFVIEGYLMRFVAEPALSEFLILPDPPTCPFCGGSGYGPYLEVQMKEPLDDLPDYTKLRIRGQLELIDDPTVYDAVRLIKGELVKG
ncbi:MAG: hypothetical protein AAGJ34_05090 [Pseudomonadota bacterium]